MSVSTGDMEIAVRVVHTSEAFLGRCFRCNKVGHHFHDEECEMYDPDFLNSGWGPAKTSLNDVYPEPNISNQRKEDEGAGKEGMLTHEAHAPTFPKGPKNPSPTDLPARKKHNAVPS